MNQTSCISCGGQNIVHEQKIGRTISPKVNNNRKISWKGIWNIYTCKTCGQIWENLIK